MPLLQPVLKQSLYGMMISPSSDASLAANRFSEAVESWAASAMAMGIPAVVPKGLVASGILVGEPIPSIMSRFWLTVVFPGAVGPPVGPPMQNVMLSPSPDANEAAERFSNALQLNALQHTVTFVVGGVPVVFPIL